MTSKSSHMLDALNSMLKLELDMPSVLSDQESQIFLRLKQQFDKIQSLIITSPLDKYILTSNTCNTFTLTQTRLDAGDYNQKGITINTERYTLSGFEKAIECLGRFDSFTANIDARGVMDKWQINDEPYAVVKSTQALIKNTCVYMLGNAGISASQTSVYCSKIYSDACTSGWYTGNELPSNFSASMAIFNKGYVYLIGSYVKSTPNTGVISSKLNADGTIGDWTINYILPEGVHAKTAYIDSNHLYLTGCTNKGIPFNFYYTNSIRQDGELGQWDTFPANLYLYLTGCTNIGI